MATIEVDESAVQNLQNYEKMIKALAGNPKTRTKYLELVKEISPNTPIPEIDAKREGMAALEPLAKQMADLQKRMDEDAAARAKQDTERQTTSFIDRGRRLLRDQGFMDEGVEAVEKLMKDRGIVDYEAAAALFTKLQPPEPIVPAAGRSWDLFNQEDMSKDEEMKLLMKGGKARAGEEYVKTMVPKILAEVRGQAQQARR